MKLIEISICFGTEKKGGSLTKYKRFNTRNMFVN